MAKLSILIANYNNGRFFEDAYDSLIRQTEDDWEAVILDDGSEDNSVEIIKARIGNDNRFSMYQNEENKGVAYTKSKLIQLATTGICGFLDPDDTLAPNAVEVMLKEHNKHPNVSLVYSNKIVCNEVLEVIRINKKHQIKNDDDFYFNIGNPINHFNTFKKSFYNKTSGIDTALGQAEDQDLYLKLYEVGDVLYTDNDLYNYRLHKGGISTGGNSLSNLPNEYKTDYWHWYVIMKTAERRCVNVEKLFAEYFVRIDKHQEKVGQLDSIKKSRWVRLGRKLGFMKWLENR